MKLVLTRFWLGSSLLCLACLTVGCERKERVIDIKTPGGEIEVERNIDTGAVDVEVDKNN